MAESLCNAVQLLGTSKCLEYSLSGGMHKKRNTTPLHLTRIYSVGTHIIIIVVYVCQILSMHVHVYA